MTMAANSRNTSADRRLTIIMSPDGKERVLIVQRPDGHYSYRRQWRSGETSNHPDSPIFESDFLEGGPWGPPGPYCGIYDSEHTAEQEAFYRVSWLAYRKPH